MTASTRSGTHLSVLAVLGLTHLLNDLLQSLIPAAYPILKQAYEMMRWMAFRAPDTARTSCAETDLQ